ncbi:hypothetical protein BH10PSE18_BH10PSE18_14960 [soil metagenome]
MKRDAFTTIPVEVRHAHLFCGLGGGAKGFNRARPRVGNMEARFRCLGGIDVDLPGIRDFGRLSGVAGTVLDLFDHEQYLAFHGYMPPPGWREAGTADIHRAFGGERPHIVFLSAPCKGFSGLLSETKSLTGKYQALNRLTLRGVWLLLEAYKDDPVEMILFENVPRIATRGRHLLDQITGLLRSYGYAVAETTHDCGEIGGLAQSRKRFLLVARHIEKVPPFLYEPEKRPLRAVGDVLGRMLLPGDLRAGPMHRVPSLQWKTWVRLAFVEAGSDWRSLNKLAIENGQLRDYLVVPAMHNGSLGVREWSDHAGVVAGASRPHNGSFSIADPRKQLYAAGYGVTPWDGTAGAVAGESLPSNGRFAVADPRSAVDAAQYSQYGVLRMSDTAGAIIGVKSPGQGTFSVADPRHAGPAKHSNEFRIVPWDTNAQAVTSAHGTGQAVADPRGGERAADLHGRYHITPWSGGARAVIAGSTSGEGAFAVADPRSGMQRGKGDAYLTAGHYGVLPWAGPAGAVSAAACHDNGSWSVADPRAGTPGTFPASCVPADVPAMPGAADKLICRIQALDGTWHRPFTTLELAALQSLVDPEEHLELDGLSDQAWRERIGNAVPSDAACAIAEVMGTTLLLAWSGETFMLSSQPLWVRDVAVAISVRGAA